MERTTSCFNTVSYSGEMAVAAAGIPSPIRSVIYGKNGFYDARSRESRLAIRTSRSPRGARVPRFSPGVQTTLRLLRWRRFPCSDGRRSNRPPRLIIVAASGDAPRMDACHRGDANGDVANNYVATEFQSSHSRKKPNWNLA